MAHRVPLFIAFPAATFGSAVLLSIRTRYRAAVEARFVQRLSLWCRETWKEEAGFILELVCVGIIPTALLIALLLLH